jgi:hypothetical protein
MTPTKRKKAVIDMTFTIKYGGRLFGKRVRADRIDAHDAVLTLTTSALRKLLELQRRK